MKTRFDFRSVVYLAALAALGNFAIAPAVIAHEADETPASSAATPNPAALVQLESVRHAIAHFRFVPHGVAFRAVCPRDDMKDRVL